MRFGEDEQPLTPDLRLEEANQTIGHSRGGKNEEKNARWNNGLTAGNAEGIFQKDG